MDVKQFVQETLQQVIAGVREAQRDAPRHSAAINPPRYRYPPATDRNPTGAQEHQQQLSTVDFDIAVTSDEAQAGRSGAGVRVIGIFNAGGQSETSTTASSISRVRFSVPLSLPEQL